MPQSADVRSIDAVRRFHASVLEFQEEARLCISALEMQLLRVMGWLEQDRPGFWKREIENCYREQSEARVRLHQCRMRKVGDWKPTCFEEKKALEKAKKDLEFAQKQIPVVKYWNVTANQEANEYHGRASRLTQAVERDLPALIGLLEHAIDRLEAYGNVQTPGTPADTVAFNPAGGDVADFASDSSGQPDAPSPMETAPEVSDSTTPEQDSLS